MKYERIKNVIRYMITEDEIQVLLNDLESDRVERTISTTNTDKFGQAICAFANENRSSVCSVDVVIARNGVMADNFYSLIKPEPNYYRWFCREVLGLGHEDTDGADVFPKVWARVEPRFGIPNHYVRLERC